jgi:hypothetical protein
MEAKRTSRPSVSRETRLLLLTVLFAVVALWVLARLRFPERPITANPVAPILSQLVPAPGFEDLASAVFSLQSRLTPNLFALKFPSDMSISHAASFDRVALRIAQTVAVTIIDGTAMPAHTAEDLTILARDPVSGLTVIKTSGGATSPLTLWTVRRPTAPRYMVAAESTRGAISLRPIFLGSLHAVVSPTWFAPLWAMPPHTDVDAGAFLFTTDGELAGVVTEHDGPALVPADTIIAMAERLQKDTPKTAGWLGIAVQPLTPSLASATRATRGVIVSRVDSSGPVAGQLAVTDVIEAIDDAPALTPAHWLARAGRLSAGETVVLRVRRGDETREVRITAQPAPAALPERPLGLTLRRVPQVGVEVLGVAPESAAAHAGLRPGDVITVAGDYQAPTAAQVTRAFAAGTDDRPLVVGVTRGVVHQVLTLERR